MIDVAVTIAAQILVIVMMLVVSIPAIRWVEAAWPIYRGGRHPFWVVPLVFASARTVAAVVVGALTSAVFGVTPDFGRLAVVFCVIFCGTVLIEAARDHRGVER